MANKPHGLTKVRLFRNWRAQHQFPEPLSNCRGLLRWLVYINICVVASLNVFAQSPTPTDSLNAHFDQAYAQIIEEIKNEKGLNAIGMLDSLVKMYAMADDSLSIRNTFLIADAYQKLRQFEESARIHERLATITDQKHDSISLSRALYNLGIDYKRLGLIAASKSTFTRCLIFSEAIGDKMRLALTLNQIGLLEKRIGNITRAIAYLDRSLDIFEELNDKEQIAHIYNNIGSAYKYDGDYARAKEYLLKAIQINKSINNLRSLSFNYNNLANVYEETRDLEAAKDYHEKSIQLKLQIGEKPALAASYSNLAIIYELQGDIDQAVYYTNQAFSLAISENVQEMIPVILKQKANLFGLKGDQAKAIQMLEKLIEHQDSLAKNSKSTLTRVYQENLENRQGAEPGLANTKRENGHSETMNWLLVSLGALCIIMLLVVGFIFYKSFKKQALSDLKLKAHKNEVQKLRKTNDRLMTKLDETRVEIDKIKRDKDVFFSTVSHDMRGPLNAINAISSMLLKTSNEDSKDREELVVLEYSVRSLVALSDDILDFSYIESGKLRIEHKPFSLKEIIKEMIEAFQFISNEKQIDLISEMGDLPNKLVGDPRRLRQVIFNLLQNAFKFTRDGYVKINAESHLLDSNNAEITVDIEDTGIGISKLRLSDIFEKFYKVEPTGQLDKGGSGLGLFVSRALVKQMKGELTVESKVNEGSCFTIRLKLPIAHQI